MSLLRRSYALCTVEIEAEAGDNHSSASFSFAASSLPFPWQHMMFEGSGIPISSSLERIGGAFFLHCFRC